MKSVRKRKTKREIQTARTKERMSYWRVFTGICKFFSFTHNDIYFLLKADVDLDVYYTDYVRFKYTLLNNPAALMNKEDVREVVEELLNLLRDDMFSVMADPTKYDDLREKWERLIRGD